ILRSGRWYVTYWEQRSINGTIERKRVTHPLGRRSRGANIRLPISRSGQGTYGTINNCRIPAEHITTIGGFVENVYFSARHSKGLLRHLGMSRQAALCR